MSKTSQTEFQKNWVEFFAIGHLSVVNTNYKKVHLFIVVLGTFL